MSNAIDDIVAGVDLGRPSAAKRGSNPSYPYVPVLVLPDGMTRNPIRGRAYATRVVAVAAAQLHIDRLRSDLATRLREPRYRALREHYGLPREVEA